VIPAVIAFFVLSYYYSDVTQVAVGSLLLPVEAVTYGVPGLVAAALRFLPKFKMPALPKLTSAPPLAALADLEAYAVMTKNTSVLDLVADIRKDILEGQIRAKT